MYGPLIKFINRDHLKGNSSNTERIIDPELTNY